MTTVKSELLLTDYLDSESGEMRRGHVHWLTIPADIGEVVCALPHWLIPLDDRDPCGLSLDELIEKEVRGVGTVKERA